jgi:hypothetical protein
MFGIVAGGEEHQGMTTQHDALVLTGHANDGIGVHQIPPLTLTSATTPGILPGPRLKVVKDPKVAKKAGA